MTHVDIDPAGLIAEAYRIEGIGAPECRSIFLDWALQLPERYDQIDAVGLLLDAHAAQADHPMTAILREAQGKASRTGRRGGRAGRAGA